VLDLVKFKPEGSAMDGSQFDRLTRAFASGQSRRAVLRKLLGLAGGVAGSAVLANSGDARKTGTRPAPIPTPAPPPGCGLGRIDCSGV
jgi:hypothetical protein